MDSPSLSPAYARFDQFQFDLSSGELFRSGVPVPLQEQPSQVLRHLLQSSGKVVTREELCATLWPADTFVDFDLGLNTAVKKLRQALDDPAERPRYIETVHRRGYRFKFPLEWASDRNDPAATTKVEHAAPASVVPPIQSDPKPSEPRPPVPWKLKALIVLAGCLVVAGLLYPWMAPRVERQLRLLELQRLTVVPLTALPGNVASPTFSPDGSQVAFSWDGGKGGNQSSDLYVKVIGTEKLLRLTNQPGAYYAAWSPNGQSIAIERFTANYADSGVYLLSPLGGPEKKITDKCAVRFVAIDAIAWSPDGKQLACVTYTSNTTSELLLLRVDSPQFVPLKTNCKRPISPAFSPDGIYLAWVCSDILGGGDMAHDLVSSKYGKGGSSDHKISPRVGVLWQPREWLSIYGSYVENFGATNGEAVDRNNQPLPPQTAQQWEVGVKTAFGRRFLGTLAYYDLSKQNIATADPLFPNDGSHALPIGEANSHGVELDLAGTILPHWNLLVAYAYTEAKIVNDLYFGTAGNRLANVPKNGGRIWTTYSLLGGELKRLTLGGGLTARSVREGDMKNDYLLPGFATVDAMASYSFPLRKSNLVLQVNIHNLLNRDYFEASGDFLRGRIAPGSPLAVMSSIRFEF